MWKLVAIAAGGIVVGAVIVWVAKRNRTDVAVVQTAQPAGAQPFRPPLP